ncbi:hypothetical protein N5K55_05455 [Pseudomonas aeruginosa]|nr:hypothetical protein [Pseudomonas aeruginosa]
MLHKSRFEYIMCKGLVDEFGDAGLSIELYVIQDAIETLAQADYEHGCDSSTSSILQYYGLVGDTRRLGVKKNTYRVNYNNSTSPGRFGAPTHLEVHSLQGHGLPAAGDTP